MQLQPNPTTMRAMRFQSSAAILPVIGSALRHLLLALAVLAGSVTWAARPMITDDARIVDAQSCQLETWVRRTGQGHEYWALPACNPTGGVEVTLGGTRQRADAETLAFGVAQAKGLFRTLDSHAIAMGWVLGVQRRPGAPGTGRASDAYVYMPVTWQVRDDAWFVHLNIGVAQDHAAGVVHRTWGLASESRLSSNVWLIAETFGQSKPDVHYGHAGLRIWLVPNRVQVDTTVGQRLSGGLSERWLSLGLRLLTPPLW